MGRGRRKIPLTRPMMARSRPKPAGVASSREQCRAKENFPFCIILTQQIECGDLPVGTGNFGVGKGQNGSQDPKQTMARVLKGNKYPPRNFLSNAVKDEGADTVVQGIRRPNRGHGCARGLGLEKMQKSAPLVIVQSNLYTIDLLPIIKAMSRARERTLRMLSRHSSRYKAKSI